MAMVRRQLGEYREAFRDKPGRALLALGAASEVQAGLEVRVAGEAAVLVAEAALGVPEQEAAGVPDR